jgi:hypothetical protein
VFDALVVGPGADVSGADGAGADDAGAEGCDDPPHPASANEAVTTASAMRKPVADLSMDGPSFRIGVRGEEGGRLGD